MYEWAWHAFSKVSARVYLVFIEDFGELAQDVEKVLAGTPGRLES